MTKNIINLLHKDLSYIIRGTAFEVRKDFGAGHKEQIYQKAFEEELKAKKISYEREKAIKIFSPKTGKFIGLYRPDFIVDGKIIVELKTQSFLPKVELTKIYDYLRNSEYELGYLINFGSAELYVNRVIFTNDRKPALKNFLMPLSAPLAFISSLLVLFSVYATAQAAVLQLESPVGQAYVNQRTEIAAVFDPGTEVINALEGSLEFSAKSLDILDISDGGVSSLLWVKKPEIVRTGEKWLINFSAVAPGGLRGYLFSIIARPRIEGTITLGSGSGSAFLNDGQGTKQDLQILSFSLSAGPENLNSAESAGEPDDRVPPENFNVQVARDSQIFNNQWFIVFHTRDQGLGLEGFEVLETREAGNPETLPGWEPAVSPYVLKEQKLSDRVYVKAVDRAGNWTVTEVKLPKIEIAYNYANKIIWSIILLSLFAVLFWLVKRRYFSSAHRFYLK